MLSHSHIELFKKVRLAARDYGRPLYLIGGTLRDLLLESGPYDRDFDFVVEGDAIDCARCARERLGGLLTEHKAFVTAKLSGLEGYSPISEIDFASARRETYARPGALPEVSFSGIMEDLCRRDFSINALAVEISDFIEWASGTSPSAASLAALVIDKFGGVGDLKSKTIRILHPNSFIDDPTRIFRAARYASRIGGRLDPGTEAALYAAINSQACATLSVFRKMTEIRKICGEARPCKAFDLLYAWGILGTLSLPPTVLEELRETWSKLDNFVDRGGEETKYEAFLTQAVLLTPDKDQEAVGKLLGLGKKRVLAISKNYREAPAKESLEILTDGEVIAHFLFTSKQEDKSEHFLHECSERGLLRASEV